MIKDNFYTHCWLIQCGYLNMLLWTNHARAIWDNIQLEDNLIWQNDVYLFWVICFCLEVQSSSPFNVVQMKYTLATFQVKCWLVFFLKFNLYSVNSRLKTRFYFYSKMHLCPPELVSGAVVLHKLKFSPRACVWCRNWTHVFEFEYWGNVKDD